MISFLQRNKYDLLLITLLPALLIGIVELISRSSPVGVIKWVIGNPSEFMLNYLLYFGLANICLIFSRKIYVVCNILFLVVLSAAAYVSNIKLKFRGEPIHPWDLKLEKEALEVSNYLTQSFSFKAPIVVLIVVVALIVMLRFIGNRSIKWPYTIASIVISALLLYGIYTDKPFDLKQTFGVEYINWSQDMHYKQNGLLYGFAQSFAKMKIKEPNNYSEQNITAILDGVATKSSEDEEVKPNIIYIMSEAFWDPTVLPEIEFETDPIPFFHQLQAEGTSGELLSHIYGGATVNTEFEAITGFTTQFLPQGSMPYTNFINSPTYSLAWLLKEQQYATSAIHSYTSWFYRRDKVYKHLGFDSYTPAELFGNTTKNGEFIRDVHMVDNILERLKQTDERDFIHAVSMEAHGPYPSAYEEDRNIKITGDISASSKEIIESYASKINGADKALEKLIRELEMIDEPTVVLFFGDHLPALGTNLQVYRELNYFQSEENYEDYLKMYTLPFIVWDNYSNKKEQIRMTPNFLTPFVLSNTTLERGLFYEYLNELHKSGVEVIPKEHFYSNEQLDTAALENYRLLQYDMMFGKHYYKDAIVTYKDNEHYELNAIFKPQIDSYSPTMLRKEQIFNPFEDSYRISIFGENLHDQLSVYNGEQQLFTKLIDDNELMFYLPASTVNENEKLQFDLAEVDEKQRIISKVANFEMVTVNGEKYVEMYMPLMKQVVLNGNEQWELFEAREDFSSFRLNVNLPSSTNYLLFQNDKEFTSSNADQFDATYLADIYENGYLYITLPKAAKATDSASLQSYLQNHPLTLYVEERQIEVSMQ